MPDAWLDRLFARLAAMYGKHWVDMWADVPPNEVRACWAEDLACVTGEQISAALAHLRVNNKFPPTAPEFAMLCRQFYREPSHQYVSLPHGQHGQMDPRIAKAIHELTRKDRKRDPKDWARTILKEHAAGTYRFTLGVQGAKEALGIRDL